MAANAWMAEGVGFEPTREREPPGGFQDRCLKPLGHPSNYNIFNGLVFSNLRKNPSCYHFFATTLRFSGAAMSVIKVFETASRANGGRLWLVWLMTLRGSPLVLQAA
jgi:hypothetical protein